jgi:hypothetical protein
MRLKWWIIGFLVCLAVACLSPLASASPDGLQRVAAAQGFAGRVQNAPFQILASYVFPGVENATLAKILSGLIGTLVVFLLVFGISQLLWLRKRKHRNRLNEV